MKKYLYIITALLISSCSSIKDKLITKGGINEARENVITDIMAKHSKKGDFFDLTHAFYKTDDKYIFTVYINEPISIPLAEKMNTKTNSFPSRYIEKKNRLFFWRDSTYVVTDDIVYRMEQYRAMLIFPVIGNKINAYVYLVCKNDITNYKMRKLREVVPKYYSVLKCSRD